MPATFKDICAKTGLSKATVSRTLNNHPHISKKTRERVLSAMKGLNYTPSAAARSLSRRKSDLIGIILPAITSGYYASVIQGVDHLLQQREYNLITVFSHGTRQEFHPGVKLLSERRVDGLLLLEPSIQTDDLVALKKQELPFVLLQQSIMSHVSSVSIDNKAGAFEMTNHLIKQGYKRILVVTGPEYSLDSIDRLEGYRTAMKNAARKIDESLIITSTFKAAEAVPKVMPFFEKANPPDAIFAFNDDIALGLIREFRLRHDVFPKRPAIAGFDGIDTAEFAGLTTLCTPLTQVGELAAELLLNKLEGKVKGERQILLKGSLVVRESTLCPSRVW